ncbi:hypothetical protein D917_08444 [Trichinella nativa]|uniref:Uncharacterized protein n=1 Tax=Trichinella nativa TaxID=6335 RepID=A0A1Y3EK36_9BILA|nr:hypothetical protein D917_08444 [Trichinella nativa]
MRCLNDFQKKIATRAPFNKLVGTALFKLSSKLKSRHCHCLQIFVAINFSAKQCARQLEVLPEADPAGLPPLLLFLLFSADGFFPLLSALSTNTNETSAIFVCLPFSHSSKLAVISR